MRDAVTKLLVGMGEDVDREGLRDTPKRVAKMWEEVLDRGDPPTMTCFDKNKDGVECDQMVVVSDIRFRSFCEHHLLPFIGFAHIGYIPSSKVVGLSKIPRVVDYFSSRFQIQERLTSQIADFIMETVKPHGVCVLMEAEHLCVSIRGVEKPGHNTITQALRGYGHEMWVEFLSLLKMRKR
jgi:GTP cyclohydrolase I